MFGEEEKFSAAEMAKKERERRKKIAEEKKVDTTAVLDEEGDAGTLGAATIKIEVNPKAAPGGDPAAQKAAEKNLFSDAARALAKDLWKKIFKTGNRTTNLLGQEIYQRGDPKTIQAYEDFWNRMSGVKPENQEAGTAVFFTDHFKPLLNMPMFKAAHSNYAVNQKKLVNSDEMTDEDRDVLAREDAEAINALADRKKKKR